MISYSLPIRGTYAPDSLSAVRNGCGLGQGGAPLALKLVPQKSVNYVVAAYDGVLTLVLDEGEKRPYLQEGDVVSLSEGCSESDAPAMFVSVSCDRLSL